MCVYLDPVVAKGVGAVVRREASRRGGRAVRLGVLAGIRLPGAGQPVPARLDGGVAASAASDAGSPYVAVNVAAAHDSSGRASLSHPDSRNGGLERLCDNGHVWSSTKVTKGDIS